MPQNWGQRYFEEQPPGKDGGESPPDKKNARFHEVFGNRKVRTFQRGRGGRWHPRGRGRGRGRGQGNRGNSFTSGRNPERRDDRGDAEEADKEYEYNGRPRNIFTAGSKRPAFGQRDSGGRRKKRYVPGGLIPKFQRIEEYRGETYCDVCNEGFRDLNAKALHDRSYKHRRNYGFLRHESRNQPDEGADKIANPAQQSEEDRRKQLEDGVAAFLSLKSKGLPKPFEEWVNRSLAAAKEAALEAKDMSLLQAVQVEIVDVYRVNDANCTLRRVCWTRRELASGSAYRSSEPKPTGLPVIPDSKVHIKDALKSKKEEEPKAGKPQSAPKPPPTPKDIVVEIRDDADIASRTDVEHPPNNPRPADSTLALQSEHVPYRVVEVDWRTSRAAEELQSCCEIRDKEALLANYYDIFGKTKGRIRDSDLEQEDLESTESLMSTFRGLRRQYESEDYEYNDLMDGLSTLAKELEKDGKRFEQLRHIHRMQIQIALQAGEFRDCFEPCSKFVRTYSQRRSVRGLKVDTVGHWLVSLLFKNKTRGRKGFPEMLEVAQEMRRLPEGAIEDIWVYEAIQAIKAVLQNNWCGFFARGLSSIVHCRGSTSKQILEGLVPFMREKALLVVTHTDIHSKRAIGMKAPADVPLEDARRLLGWDSSQDVEGSIAEAKDFVSSLSQPFELVCKDDTSDWIRWMGKDDEDLTLSGDSDAREEMLTKWAKPIILEED